MNWQTFYKLNKSRILPIFLLYLLISFSAFFIIGVFNCVNGVTESLKEILIYASVYGLPIGCLVYIITLGSSFVDGKIRHSLMEEKPLNQLNKIGFEPILVGQNSTFKFGKLVFGKFISYYPIILSISDYKGNTTITFNAYYKRKNSTLTRKKEIEKNILRNNINYSRTKLSISFSADKLMQTNINQIDQKLHEMIALMKLYDFEPKT